MIAIVHKHFSAYSTLIVLLCLALVCDPRSIVEKIFRLLLKISVDGGLRVTKVIYFWTAVWSLTSRDFRKQKQCNVFKLLFYSQFSCIPVGHTSFDCKVVSWCVSLSELNGNFVKRLAQCTYPTVACATLRNTTHDEGGIRTHACRTHWISSPTP